MADENSRDKKAKLANTRKRFKELQELKRQKEASASPTSSIERSSVSPSLAPTPSNYENNSTSQNAQFDHTFAQNSTLQTPENQYVAYNNTNMLPNQQPEMGIIQTNTPNNADFFDNLAPATKVPQLPQVNTSQDGSTLLTYFDTSQPDDNALENTEQNIGLARYFDNTVPNFEDVPSQQFQGGLQNANYSLFPQESAQSYVSDIQHITHPHAIPDNLTEEDPAVLNNVTENNHTTTKTLPDIFGPQGGTQNLIDYLDSQGAQDVINQEDPPVENHQVVITDSSVAPEYPDVRDLRENNIFYPSTSTQNLPDCYYNQENLSVLESDEIKDQINRSTDLAKQEAQHSSVENLRQFSNQVAGIIDTSYEYSESGGITDLEKRNLELAAQLEKEKLNNEKLTSQNHEYLKRINDLETMFRQQENSLELQSHQEISRLKDELQNHFQTIGLLVAEKTELSAIVNQHELSLKQKNSECEELQARLKASRSRVADLERELGHLKEEKSKIENLGGQYSTNYEVVKKEYESLKEQKEELAQDLLETKERLKQALNESAEVQQQNKDLTSKLSLANIKIQQLTSSDDLANVGSQIEQLTQQKFALENELANANQMLKTFIKERDEARTEYQHYAEQLNAQLTTLQGMVEKLQQEKENLIVQEQNRIRHIGELERQLQTLQDNQISYATRNTSNNELKTELDNYREMVVQLETGKTSMEENYTKVCNEKELFLKELEAKTDSIAQLESMIDQLRGNQPDSVKLLATMESDKVAAARAVQQNKELKSQMESMQEVFAKLDNDKINLTDQLDFEHKTNKELMEKLQKTELHLQTLADAIEIKDKELLHLRNSFEDINRQAIQHEQLEDRLRHYEAHDHSAHSLQNELLEAKTTIAKLTNQLNQLRNIQANWDTKSSEKIEGEEPEDNRTKDNIIVELTNEINKLKAELNDRGVVENATNLENLRLNGTTENSDDNQNALDKETQVKFLEEKVKRTMQEIADLTDEKQKLEYIIQQLQGETETIEEYVALYQHQRMILKQKALEKDYQLKQLANDREQIKGKLDRLNQLIQKLVSEKGVIPDELIQHQQSINNQANSLCEIHSQMNNEVNSRIAKEKDNSYPMVDKESVPNSSRTAEEIISLLSEIKTSNLVEPEDSFHHCPYCSGQLITV